MSARSYYLADVFSATPFCGNPLAVVTDGEGLDTARMQQMAREFNLSETAFLSATERPDCFGLRIFAPTQELPFAGHPTLGAAHVLAHSGRLALEEGENRIILREAVGEVVVSIRVQAGKPVFCQFTAPGAAQFGEPLPGEALASILGLLPEDLVDGVGGPDAAGCGVPFHLIPLRRMASLSAIQFDTAAYHLWGRHSWAQSFCAFVRDPYSAQRLHMRVFSPAFGFLEDPATGAAAAALAAVLARQDGRNEGNLRWEIWQGYDMGRPSQLYIEADRFSGSTTALRVGGTAVVIGEGRLYV